MKMASRLIDLITKRTYCTCSTLFLAKLKTNLHVQHAFCLSLAVVLHDYNAVLYD